MGRLRLLIAFCLGAAVAGGLPDRAEETSDRPERVDIVESAACDPSYPTLCIPVGASDLDCADIHAVSFPVRGSDPHGFDADHDGRGCEPDPRRSR